MVDPVKVKVGKPCPKCGGRERWISNRSCIRCKREATRQHMAGRYHALTGPEYAALLLKRRRTKALARMAKREERRTSGAL